MSYRLTLLEQQVKDLYHSLRIYRPDQMDLESIAAKLSIWVHVAPFTSKAQRFKGLYSIILDSRLSDSEQWEDFGHEVCHVLNHAGNQLQMPKPFKEFQESKANNFALHFCVPTFMILDSGLPYTWNEATLFVMDTYNVTEHFARKRLEHFNKQVIGFEFHEAFRKSIEESLLPVTT
jgi:Zn-dependent peptidase ImmA (M78 family)